MSFLRAYTAVDAGDPEATASARVALLRQWMLHKPHALFAELRQEQPIFATPGFVLLTRHAEVREALLRDDVFSAAPYADRLQPLVSSFLLGSDDTATHERDAAMLRLVIRRHDLEDIAGAAEQAANIAVATRGGGMGSVGGRTRARAGDRMDGVGGLARPLVADFLARYLGVAGPEPEVLLRWARKLARAIFCNDGNTTEVLDEAREAGAELGGYIDVLLASRRTQIVVGNPAGEDAVGRLLALQGAQGGRPDDRRLRELLVGVIVSTTEPTIAAIAHVLHEIMQRADVQTRAIAAVAGDEPQVLAAIVDEALRFAPPLWTPARLCTRPFTLARGTANETVLRPGTRVLASTFSAGFDPAEVEAPDEFRAGRRTHQSLGFGVGLHACLGRHIAPVLVRAAVTALLRNGGVRPLADRVGLEGPFPSSLPLEFTG